MYVIVNIALVTGLLTLQIHALLRTICDYIIQSATISLVHSKTWNPDKGRPSNSRIVRFEREWWYGLTKLYCWWSHILEIKWAQISTSGYVFTLVGGAISWKSNEHKTLHLAMYLFLLMGHILESNEHIKLLDKLVGFNDYSWNLIETNFFFIDSHRLSLSCPTWLSADHASSSLIH